MKYLGARSTVAHRATVDLGDLGLNPQRQGVACLPLAHFPLSILRHGLKALRPDQDLPFKYRKDPKKAFHVIYIHGNRAYRA